MKIELRQHQDGSFVIVTIHNGSVTREINITHVIHEIFREKLLDLQARVTNDEKYLNWMVESAKVSKSVVSTAYSRYKAMVERLNQTNTAISQVTDSWLKGKDLKKAMTDLSEVKEMNQHFLENDTTLQTLEDLSHPPSPIR